MPSIPSLNQQDLQHFVVPPDEYIPERQANLTIKEIAAAYAPPVPSNQDDPSTASSHSASLDDSEPRPLITRTELNQALEVLQLYIIQTAPQSATPQDTASLMDSITTLTNLMWELSTKRKQQSHLEKWLGVEWGIGGGQG